MKRSQRVVPRWQLRTMRGVLRRWSTARALCAGASIFAPGLAHADDWGCQVLLCLSSPGGPEQYSACVPPIEKLWRALRHGDPFPSCDFGSSGSQGPFASGAYCRDDLLYRRDPEQRERLGRATGAINPDLDRQLHTRVWWDVAGTGPVIVDPSRATALFLQQVGQQTSAGGGSQ
ncbi:hypothetical protein [Paraburkholderia sediminicola]|uniref:hypothetical protein n=1 Tax=Paraburkholderia sediminicola TaxID=458836 RepID=UPI0038B74467